MPQTLYNPASELCPSREVLDLIADKWTVLIINALAKGVHRFGALQRSVEGISQKMLTQTLRTLERDGIVSRKVFAEVPPRTEYSLTPLGETLIDAMSVLFNWAANKMPEIETARHAYQRSNENSLIQDN